MIEKITIYLVDDEFVYRKRLQEIILSFSLFSNDLSVQVIPVEELETFFISLNDLTINDNDIFLIDIDLQTYFSGIDIAKKIRQKNQQSFILFLTNSETKGIDIINQKIFATSYLVKGSILDSQMLEEALYSIKSEIIQRLQDKDSYLSLKKFGQIVFIKYEDIIYIKSMAGIRNTLVVHMKDSEQVVEGTINKLKPIIESPYLYTELKSYIINRTHISSLERSTGLITFDDGSELEVSKRIIDKLKSVL